MRLSRLILAFTLTQLLAGLARAQDLRPETPAEIQARLTAAGDDPAVAEPTDEVIKALRAAKAAAEATVAARDRAADFRGQTEAAPAQKSQIEAELKLPPEAAVVSAPPGATLAELERLLAQADANAKAARAELDTLIAEDPRRAKRLTEIPVEVAQFQAEVDRLAQVAATPPPTEVAPALVEARRVRTAAEWGQAKARIAELQAEAASYDGRRDLLVLRRNRAERRAKQTQDLLAGWQQLVAKRRAGEAADAARQASDRDLAAADEIPELAPIAEQIRELVADLQGERAIPRRLTDAVADLNETNELLQSRINQGRTLRQRVDKAGAAPYGTALQDALRDLKDVGGYRLQLARYRRQLADAQYRKQALAELANEASDTGKALGEVLVELGDSADANRELATRLLDQRWALVRQAQDTYESYDQTLLDLIKTYSEYLGVTESMLGFVEQHVFSVRSVARGRLIPSRADFAYDIRWLLDREAWRRSALQAADAVIPGIPPAWTTGQAPRPRWHFFVLPIGSGGLLALGFLARLRLVARARRPLPTTGRVRQMSMAGTLLKLFLAAAAAAPVPLAMWLISAWLLSTAEALSVSDKVPTPTPLAVAAGLSRGAYVLLGLGVLRELVRAGAVGVSHFRWPETGLGHLRRHLRWFTPVATVSAGVIETFNERTNDNPEVLGRLTMLAVLAVVAVFQFVVLSPRRPFMAEYCKRYPDGVFARTSWLWFPVVVALPALLAVATMAGYVYTALQVQRRLGDSFLFIMLVIVGQSLVLRSLQLARRKIAIDAAKARMAAAEAESGGERPKEPEPAVEVDLNAVNIQSRKVIQAVTVVVLVLGLYGVWSEVLPALRWFERLQVLPTIRYIEPQGVSPIGATIEVDPSASNAAPNAAAAPTPGLPQGAQPAAGSDPPDEVAALPVSITSVTVADLGLALLLLMLTVSASRNVPGLLEITLLPRLPINAAARYAVFTVARYVVIIIGIVAVSRVLEIPWKSAQWLAAALTFGLAFGLQEIFANFVSGLIILFEQPIRVGDTVTVAGVNGTVAKVRMRATTIVDWDRKELVIPNKTFITDQIVNWTLSDPICRVIIPVGIAYGSDTERARDLLLQCSRESSHTLDEPAARALFLGFGDNSLNFELRVFIDDLENLMAVKSDLHFRIDKAFREAGIEIAFPQRDLHLRSVDERILEGIGGKAKEEGGRMKDEG